MERDGKGDKNKQQTRGGAHLPPNLLEQVQHWVAANRLACIIHKLLMAVHEVMELGAKTEAQEHVKQLTPPFPGMSSSLL